MCFLTKNHEDGDSDKGNVPFFHYATLLATRGFFYALPTNPGSKEVFDFFL